ncbi:MAG TPA: hypothetical protein VJ625_14295 [Propionibacteriaceae bacterium]|nr:hypothetical protein [Propionibacteriaceae bacterium]
MSRPPATRNGLLLKPLLDLFAGESHGHQQIAAGLHGEFDENSRFGWSTE